MTTEPDDAVRKKIAEDIALVCAGHRVVDAWAALTDHMSAMIGFAADDKEHALSVCDQVAADFKRNIEKHLDFYRAQRGQHVDRPGGRG